MVRLSGALVALLALNKVVFGFGGAIVAGAPAISGVTISPDNVTASTLTVTGQSNLGAPVEVNSDVGETAFALQVSSQSGPGTALIRVNGNGRVGIGTTSPQTVLDVAGASQLGSGATKSTF